MILLAGSYDHSTLTMFATVIFAHLSLVVVEMLQCNQVIEAAAALLVVELQLLLQLTTADHLLANSHTVTTIRHLH